MSGLRLQNSYMNILIACEESATLRELFNKAGHNAWSCDLKPSRVAGNHYRGSVFDILSSAWDMLIAHPPCTRLSVAGNAHRVGKEADEAEAVAFFMEMVNAPVERICVENPIGIMSTRYCAPTQIVQPFFFGDAERKATCLWLKGLPPLQWASEPDLFNPVATAVKPQIVTMTSKKTGRKRTYSNFGSHCYYLRFNRCRYWVE